MVDSSGALVIILLSYSFFFFLEIIALRIIYYAKEQGIFLQLKSLNLFVTC